MPIGKELGRQSWIAFDQPLDSIDAQAFWKVSQGGVE
jgi:hypothetical protein